MDGVEVLRCECDSPLFSEPNHPGRWQISGEPGKYKARNLDDMAAGWIDAPFEQVRCLRCKMPIPLSN